MINLANLGICHETYVIAPLRCSELSQKISQVMIGMDRKLRHASTSFGTTGGDDDDEEEDGEEDDGGDRDDGNNGGLGSNVGPHSDTYS